MTGTMFPKKVRSKSPVASVPNLANSWNKTRNELRISPPTQRVQRDLIESAKPTPELGEFHEED